MAHTLDSALLAFGRFVREHYGIPPSRRDLIETMGIASLSSAGYWFDRLEQHGLIFEAIPRRNHYGNARAHALTREGRIRLAELEMGEEVTQT